MSLAFTITDAGRAALINAQHTGSAAIQIAEIGVAASHTAGSLAGLTALPGEIKRLVTFGGAVVAADVIHVTVRDETEDAYAFRAFGLYLSDGTLFGLYSQAAVILEKSPAAMTLIAADITLTSLSTAAITFGGTGFINPPATTTVQGVVELATPVETAAGTDGTRAVTPLGLISVLTAWASNFASAVHTHTIDQISGLAAALAGKSSTGHTHSAADTTAGVFDVARIPDLAQDKISGLVSALAGKAASGHQHDAADIVSGLLNVLRIPDLAQSKITGLVAALAGKAATSHQHDAGDIISGILNVLRVPDLAISKITGLAAALAGKSDAGHTHDASGIVSGIFNVLRIPDLAQSKISGLTDALAGKAAAAHTHVMADVTGLSAALALLFPKTGGTMSGALTIQAQPAAAGADIFSLKPTDWGPGKPGMFMKQQGATWSVTLYDGQGVTGALNIDATSLAINNATVWSTANFNPADKANAIHSHDWGQITGKGDVVLKSATGLGVVGPGPLTQFATANQYGSLPTGWTSMMVPGSFGLPNGYGYLMKTGRRDAGDGWSGIFTSHVSAVGERASLWFGSTTDGTTMPVWSRAWSDANLLAASPTEAAAGVAADRFVSPAALWSFARNLGSPGYAVIPGTGLMIQWGISTGSTPEGEAHAYLPTAFGGGCVVALAVPRNPSRNINTDFYMQVAARFIDRIVFFANRANGSSGNLDGGFEWIALGKVSGTADPAYSAGGAGGGGGLGGGGQVEP